MSVRARVAMQLEQARIELDRFRELYGNSDCVNALDQYTTSDFFDRVVNKLWALGAVGKLDHRKLAAAASRDLDDFKRLLLRVAEDDREWADKVDSWKNSSFAKALAHDRALSGKVFLVAKKIVTCYHPGLTLPIFATQRLEGHVTKFGYDLDDLTKRSRFAAANYRHLSVGEKWELLTETLLVEKAKRDYLKNWDNFEYMVFLEEGSGPGDLFDLFDFHPLVRKSSEHLYKSGDYRNAIKNAFENVEAAVRQKSSRTEHGTALMNAVFSKSAPILRVSTEPSEQQGTLELLLGAMSALRNRASHKKTPDQVHHYDPYEALEELAVASLLCRRIDAADVQS